MNNQNNKTSKNCKNSNKKVKNRIQNSDLNCKNAKNNIWDIELIAWVKTLIYVHDAIPNIIKYIDSLVSAKATTPTCGSLIFGDYKRGTYNQIEEVLNLQDRKLSLINLYTIIETMVNSLSQKYKAFVCLKFYKHKTGEYIAEELEIDERTAYRWSNSIINKLVEYCKSNNWSVAFFKSQTKQEPWLREHYYKHYSKLLMNNK